MRTGGTLVRVRPGSADGWEVREPGNKDALASGASQEEATQCARAMLTAGGTIQVLDAGGFLITTEAVAATDRRPWWYLQSRGILWVLGPVLVAQGLLRVTDEPSSPSFWLGWFMILTGAFHLTALFFSRRFDRELRRAVLDTDSR